MPLAEQRGGAELALLHLLEFGRDQGMAWSVVFLEDGPMVERARELGATAVVIEAGRLRQPVRFVRTVRAIARRARDEMADVVLSWMGKAQLYGGPAAKLAGVPGVWFQMGNADGWMDRLATRLPAKAIFACSKFSAQGQAKVKPRRYVVPIQLAAELEKFNIDRMRPAAELRQKLDLPTDGPIVGIAGRLQTWKGMHVLLDAMPSILKHHPESHCLIVGGEHKLEADYPRKLEEQCERLRISEQVIFAGHQSNVPEWMAVMDVVVHASEREPFGIVVIEAMALGKPVIATVPGGPAEVITDGVDGQLVPHGDERALSEAVLRYLADPDFARACGVAGRQRAQAFSSERFAREVVQAVEELVAGYLARCRGRRSA